MAAAVDHARRFCSTQLQAHLEDLSFESHAAKVTRSAPSPTGPQQSFFDPRQAPHTQNCLPVTACTCKACPSRMTFASGHAEADTRSPPVRTSGGM
jgi:hypothetical protein